MKFFIYLSKNTISQIILLISIPIITNFYTPEEVGILNLFTAMVLIIATLSTLRLEIALLRKPEFLISNLNFTAFLIVKSIIITFLLLVAFFVINIIFEYSKLNLYYLFFGGVVFSLYNILTYYCNGIGYFNTSANSKLIKSVMYLFLVIILSQSEIAEFDYRLVVIFIFSNMIGLFFILSKIENSKQRISIKRTVKIAKVNIESYRNIIKYTFPHHLINNFASNAPILLLSSFFNIKLIGLYAITNKLLLAPIGVLTASCSTYMANTLLSKYETPINKKKFLYKFIILLIAFGCAAAMLIIILGKYISIFLGIEWIGVQQIANLMIPLIVLLPLSSTLSIFPALLNYNKEFFLIEIIGSSIRIAALTPGIIMNDFNKSILYFSIISLIVFFFQIVWILRIIKRKLIYERV